LLRRVAVGELRESLAKEAEYLSKWLSDMHPQAPSMSPKSIANNCRGEYRSARNNTRN
jgi:hypothetical protein